MRRISVLTALTAIPIFLPGCDLIATPATIAGTSHNYSIPPRFVKNPQGSLFGSLPHGDQAPVTSLLIRDRDLQNYSLGDKTIAILLFHDRTYLPGVGSRNMVSGQDDMTRTDDVHGFAHSYGMLGNTRIDMYANFDPDSVMQLTEEHFVARVMQQPPFAVAGRRIEPAPSCKLFWVQDGISIQLTGFADHCAATNLELLKSVGSDLLSSWRLHESN